MATTHTPGPWENAHDTVDVDGKQVLRFHPLHKRIKDGIPRCISCGQIDEIGWHEEAYCPGAGGDLPFTTSTLKLTLKADSGFRSESSARLTLRQWEAINLIINATEGRVRRPIVDQDGNVVGYDTTDLADLVRVEGVVDEAGTVWTPPTADAYRAVCAARALAKAVQS